MNPAVDPYDLDRNSNGIACESGAVVPLAASAPKAPASSPPTHNTAATPAAKPVIPTGIIVRTGIETLPMLASGLGFIGLGMLLIWTDRRATVAGTASDTRSSGRP